MTVRQMEQPLYDYLPGVWKVKRQIEDRLANQDNWFTGEAQFVGSEAALIYREVGELAVGEARLEAAQSYKWHCSHVSSDQSRGPNR